MPTTKTLTSGLGDRAFKRPGELSSLAISPSLEELSFLKNNFEEAHWKLYTARTY